ncbi:MauE/DoxX family redox-associated membrane protein [Cytobacillus firmus]|uniref:Methylamine utilisation protein MauE domain-containing protein n=1 Tax=Cytobacillus oceanisediminis TaxID=665099 RepID=A0ABX3CNI3_9BACI|nr:MULTISPECIES: MauE/DoxX family redox-associated membrane protein [Cytobacillus]OHX44791.1 hypothetical protein BBV17_25145 [Cytobacillus oceanisediminis]
MEAIYNIGIYFLLMFFMISSISKIINLSHFTNIVMEYDVLPEKSVKLFGTLLPFIELLASISLLLDSTKIYGLMALIFLLFCFSISVIRVIKSGKKITCGCYGKFMDSKVDNLTLLKITMLMLLSIVLLMKSSSFLLEFSVFYLFMGLLVTIGVLLIQKLLSFHQETISKLNVNGVD